MRKFIILLLLVTGFACADEDKRSSRSESADTINGDTVTDTLPPGNIQQERDAMQTEKNTETEEMQQETDHSGRYFKVQQTDEPEAGRCEYVDIDLNGTSDLCIVHDKIYVTARYEKTGNNSADVYFVAPKKDEDPDNEFPWEDFDTDVPIAELQFEPGGTATLDWKGFSIGGEVATDYAIYGKKTLEGTYKKQ